nr:MAG TPA: hypothetical protein [Caudoviricetes sp.]
MTALNSIPLGNFFSNAFSVFLLLLLSPNLDKISTIA